LHAQRPGFDFDSVTDVYGSLPATQTKGEAQTRSQVSILQATWQNHECRDIMEHVLLSTKQIIQEIFSQLTTRDPSRMDPAHINEAL
jgi:hypothetical protein